GDCGILVADSASTLETLGSLHANSQTCDKAGGTAIITGTVESVAQTNAGGASPITGTFGTENGGAALIDNPYRPTVPMASTPAPITICSSGCTATSFDDSALPSW